LSSLDAVGGELNAYTTKEETVIHASFPAQYFEKAIEIMADMIFNSVFPENEIEKEKEVIVDEIASYQDDPAEQIFDDFEDDLFRGNALGRNILGNEDSIRAITVADLKIYTKKFYHPANLIFSSYGPYNEKLVLRLLAKWIPEISLPFKPQQRCSNLAFNGFNISRNRNVSQSHCILGCTSYSIFDERRILAAILNNLLAGPPMNTRLGIEIREKRGIAYNIESSFTPYTDTASFMVYFGTTPRNVNKTIDLILKVYRKLIRFPMTPRQLDALKRQIRGMVLMGSENHQAAMLSHAKSMLHFGYIEPMEETLQKLESVTALQLQEAAADFLDPDKQSILAYLPEHATT
jgi:predicted Zn-dependent peptidase